MKSVQYHLKFNDARVMDSRTISQGERTAKGIPDFHLS
jgi:hypothetical protein